MPPRVIFTEKALTLTRRLRAENGPLLFHLSGGCCEGSAPMCFRRSDFRVGPRDVLLGIVDGYPFYVGPAQFSYWAYCQLTVDVTEGGGDSFSLEAADGIRFVVRSRLFTEQEMAELEAAGPPLRGPVNDQAKHSHQSQSSIIDTAGESSAHRTGSLAAIARRMGA